jgi:DNA-binding LacI/PurR family transcriptional regulator
MSYYLNPNNALDRLRNDWNKHGSLIVAVDFDSTIYPYQYHEGDDFEAIRQLVRDLYSLGCTIIIWTASEEERHASIKYLLKQVEIPYHHFNENSPNVKFTGRKIYANAYLDDRAGLYEVFNHLNTLVTEKKLAKLKGFFEGMSNQAKRF